MSYLLPGCLKTPQENKPPIILWEAYFTICFPVIAVKINILKWLDNKNKEFTISQFYYYTTIVYIKVFKKICLFIYIYFLFYTFYVFIYYILVINNK